MTNRAVFLDRDGVINSYVYNPDFGTLDSPSNPDEFHLIDGVPEAIQAMRDLGYLVLVVSNQPGIAKGKFTPALLDAITLKMRRACNDNIHDVFYCLHHPNAVLPEYRAECDCRKPKPGLLLQAAKSWNIDLASSFMIGDGLTDIAAGHAAGAATILVSPRKCYLCDEIDKHHAMPDFVVPDLPRALPILQSNSDFRSNPHELHRRLPTRGRRDCKQPRP
jgi:D-glycero-D-manno-heptose 1,7-bisphosphate phosphatase